MLETLEPQPEHSADVDTFHRLNGEVSVKTQMAKRDCGSATVKPSAAMLLSPMLPSPMLPSLMLPAVYRPL